ncbi:H-X9-DG-CTERM domain-containing protein [Streptomyces sioyaensis]|uniref:H-X9-DG-CTERM domain-containing protein n=1 Tax=Streptomyces sioyaensis TaxID=67364 RepID=UPI0037AD3BE3
MRHCRLRRLGRGRLGCGQSGWRGAAGERETWTTEEFGSSHTGAVGVLLADGSVPAPVFFGTSCSAGGQSVSQWSVYDGESAHGPRAAALRARCVPAAGMARSTDWTGTRSASGS